MLPAQRNSACKCTKQLNNDQLEPNCCSHHSNKHPTAELSCKHVYLLYLSAVHLVKHLFCPKAFECCHLVTTMVECLLPGKRRRSWRWWCWEQLLNPDRWDRVFASHKSWECRGRLAGKCFDQWCFSTWLWWWSLRFYRLVDVSLNLRWEVRLLELMHRVCPWSCWPKATAPRWVVQILKARDNVNDQRNNHWWKLWLCAFDFTYLWCKQIQSWWSEQQH